MRDLLPFQKSSEWPDRSVKPMLDGSQLSLEIPEKAYDSSILGQLTPCIVRQTCHDPTGLCDIL